jgi:uncharacterized membrane protein YgaE (UPF0421/DUF939 family)
MFWNRKLLKSTIYKYIRRFIPNIAVLCRLKLESQRLNHNIPIPNHQEKAISALLGFTDSIHAKRIRDHSNKLILTQEEQSNLRQLTLDICVTLLYNNCAQLSYLASILDFVGPMLIWAQMVFLPLQQMHQVLWSAMFGC